MITFEQSWRTVCAARTACKDARRDPADWALKAAESISHDILDRRGIKREFQQINEYTRAEMVRTWAYVIEDLEANRDR